MFLFIFLLFIILPFSGNAELEESQNEHLTANDIIQGIKEGFQEISETRDRELNNLFQQELTESIELTSYTSSTPNINSYYFPINVRRRIMEGKHFREIHQMNQDVIEITKALDNLLGSRDLALLEEKKARGIELIKLLKEYSQRSYLLGLKKVNREFALERAFAFYLANARLWLLDGVSENTITSSNWRTSLNSIGLRCERLRKNVQFIAGIKEYVCVIHNGPIPLNYSFHHSSIGWVEHGFRDSWIDFLSSKLVLESWGAFREKKTNELNLEEPRVSSLEAHLSYVDIAIHFIKEFNITLTRRPDKFTELKGPQKYLNFHFFGSDHRSILGGFGADLIFIRMLSSSRENERNFWGEDLQLVDFASPSKPIPFSTLDHPLFFNDFRTDEDSPEKDYKIIEREEMVFVGNQNFMFIINKSTNKRAFLLNADLEILAQKLNANKIFSEVEMNIEILSQYLEIKETYIKNLEELMNKVRAYSSKVTRSLEKIRISVEENLVLHHCKHSKDEIKVGEINLRAIEDYFMASIIPRIEIALVSNIRLKDLLIDENLEIFMGQHMQEGFKKSIEACIPEYSLR